MDWTHRYSIQGKQGQQVVHLEKTKIGVGHRVGHRVGHGLGPGFVNTLWLVS